MQEQEDDSLLALQKEEFIHDRERLQKMRDRLAHVDQQMYKHLLNASDSEHNARVRKHAYSLFLSIYYFTNNAYHIACCSLFHNLEHCVQIKHGRISYSPSPFRASKQMNIENDSDFAKVLDNLEDHHDEKGAVSPIACGIDDSLNFTSNIIRQEESIQMPGRCACLCMLYYDMLTIYTYIHTVILPHTITINIYSKIYATIRGNYTCVSYKLCFIVTPNTPKLLRELKHYAQTPGMIS